MAKPKTAPKKTAAAAKLPLTVPRPYRVGCIGGAFEAGDAAYGLQFVKKGFGHTDDDDRLFALGYPHLVLPADVEVDLQALGKKLHDTYYPWHGGVWPRSLVERFLVDVDAPNAEALAGPAPELDASRILKDVATSSPPYGEVYLYMAEALWGTKRTLEAAISTWEAIGDWRESEDLDMPQAVPFLLLRVSAADRAAFLGRLELLHARAKKAFGDNWSRCVPALALAAGKAKLEEKLWDARYASPGDAGFIDLVSKRMGELKPADRAQFDGRLAFLGGDRTAGAVAGAFDRFHSTWRRALVEQLGRIRHPAAKKAMTALASKDANAKAWVAEHG